MTAEAKCADFNDHQHHLEHLEQHLHLSPHITKGQTLSPCPNHLQRGPSRRLQEMARRTRICKPHPGHADSRAHLAPAASGANGVAVGSSKVENPLAGLVPRKVTVEQAKKIMEADVNPFKGMAPFSASYKKILEGRKKLPVYDKMHEFLHIFEENQITVMEGQTGSGKTTQIPQFVCYADLPHLRGKMVACTQPRRVAAMSVAQRVADEMDGE